MVTFWHRCGAMVAAVAVVGGCGAAADLVEAEPSAEVSPSGDTTPSPSPTSESPSPSPTKPTPVAPKPKVGECRRIEPYMIGVGSDISERQTTPCGKTHNAQTYFVGRMNKPMQDAAKAGNGVRLQREVSGICGRKLTDWLGGSGEDVAVSVFKFLVNAPPAHQVQAGARWFTCDLFGIRVANKSKLAALPATTKGLLKSNRANRWARCNRGDFSDGTTNIVICTRPHTYRAIGGIHLGKAKAKYPGPQRMNRSLKSSCLGPVQSHVGASGGFNYAWTWPSSDDWKIGVHWGLCYVKSDS